MMHMIEHQPLCLSIIDLQLAQAPAVRCPRISASQSKFVDPDLLLDHVRSSWDPNAFFESTWPFLGSATDALSACSRGS